MVKTDQHSYDAIIIGAGIGGLVCGCCLAKAGMKVLIAEQHHTPGGYCTSFKRQGFTFDAAPHCFGSYRKEGLTRKILEDLGVDKKLSIMRPDPSDMIITPDYHISFWNNLEKTIQEFQSLFPVEGNNIRDFFNLLLDTDPKSFSRMRSTTFKSILDHYFTSDRLKSILFFPILAISALPPSLISAFIGAKLYSEFIFDGGYYPVGGMQALSDAIADRFKEFGGELRLSTMVSNIKLKGDKAIGVVLDKDGFIPSHYVISNGDARQTFLTLLNRDKMDAEFIHSLKNMVPSMSNFILYLGIDRNFKPLKNPGTAMFYYSHYDVEKAYRAVVKGDFMGYGGYAFRISHDNSTIYAGMPAPYKNKDFWKQNKQKLMNSFIDRIEQCSIPHLSEHLIYKDAATPNTMQRYTLNYRGASYGWAGIPSQLIVPGFRKPSFVQGLYLVGHWTTLGVGISGAAYVGYDTAKIIIKKGKSLLNKTSFDNILKHDL